MSFSQLNLAEPILRNLDAEGYTQPTPIQEQAIPVALTGQDLFGCAQTGTGKTAAFSLPVIQRLLQNRISGNGPRPVRALILTPTRELASQIGDNLRKYSRNTGLYHSVIFGGVSQYPQTQALKRGVDILVATPGRLLDLMNQRWVNLSQVEVLVLDEADRMLDMGFIHDINRIVDAMPAERQTLFFSATMPVEIQRLANNILRNPAHVEVTPVASTSENIRQELYHVSKNNKKALLLQLLQDENVGSTLVFTRTKYGADNVCRDLERAGISAQAIHGDKSQGARQDALNNFRRRRTKVLVATDIAARGIDVAELTHVFNYDLPNEAESYVHRIGRTGRAGANGVAISFCDTDEKNFLRDIQKLLANKIPVVAEHDFMLSPEELRVFEDRGPRQGNGQGGGNRRNGFYGGGNRRKSFGGSKRRFRD